MNDMSLILEFVQEAREYIDEVEPTLIEIYNGSESAAGAVDIELINSVFRLFHSMKGSAGFLSLSTVASVTHEAETLLDKIRNGKLSLTVQITATLCKALDLFREMLERQIGTLPPQCARAFRLSRLEHLTYKEIADRMGISIKAVEANVSRAIAMLREKMGGQLLPAILLFFFPAG